MDLKDEMIKFPTDLLFFYLFHVFLQMRKKMKELFFPTTLQVMNAGEKII